jgi:hypothetical protein
MDPIQIERLRVLPEEINQNTGRIRINREPEEINPARSSRPLHSFQPARVEVKETFTDLHRIGFPFLTLFGFILAGVIFYISHQRIEALEKKMLDLIALQNKSQKEIHDSLERFKADMSQDKIPSSTISELKRSQSELEVKTQALQKKLDSYNLKEVLIIESEEPQTPVLAPSSNSSTPPAKP